MSRQSTVRQYEVTIPHLAPGERLYITTSDELSPDQVAHLKRAWASGAEPGKVIVMENGMRLCVLPANTASLNADYTARFGDA